LSLLFENYTMKIIYLFSFLFIVNFIYAQESDTEINKTFHRIIYFESLSTTLDNNAYKILKEVTDYAKGNREAHLIVEGHTDNQNTKNIRDLISDERTRTVEDYLVSNGIPINKITSIMYAAEKPVGDNKTSEGRKKNRRVEIQLIEKAKPIINNKKIKSAKIARVSENIEKDSLITAIPSKLIPHKAYRKNIRFPELTLNTQIKNDLLMVIQYCQYYENIVYVVEGHTDSSWDDDFCQRLSEIRAETAKNFLIENGIDKELVEIVGYGNQNPIPSDGSFYDEKENNRLVIKLKKRLAKKVVSLKYKVNESKPLKRKKLTPEN